MSLPPLLSSPPAWDAFTHLLDARRSIRDFSPDPVADDDVRAILHAATRAPSSNNLQPWAFHWVPRGSAAHAALATACMGQRAARGAPVLIVLEASGALAREGLALQRAYYAAAPGLSDDSRAYHAGSLAKMGAFFQTGWLGLLAPFRWLLARALDYAMPATPAGLDAWAAQNAMLAAQTLLLAATARGLAACPMGGFHPRAVRRILGLRGTPALVIALGHPAPDAPLEPSWRVPLSDRLTVHSSPPAHPGR